MAELHLICRQGLNVHAVDFPVFDSGDWVVAATDAERLIGGQIFLHETKTKPSYFGGLVEGWRYANTADGEERRVIFRVRSTKEGKGAAWRGAAHGMAWTGGVVD